MDGDEYFEYENEHIGDFQNTRNFLEEHKIPFLQDMGSFDDYQPEMIVFVPGIIYFTYSLSLSGDIIVPSSDIMSLYEAIKTITFQNAAIHINSKNTISQEYAQFLLGGGDPLEFVKQAMNKFTPPPVPELPVLNIIKTKRRKS